MQQRHQELLDEYANKLQLLMDFLVKYDPPDTFDIILNTNDIPICYATINRYRTKEERDHILYVAGETFGRTGWTANQVSMTEFNWRKTVDGVRVDVDGAKRLPDPEPLKVSPNEFPLQLTEASCNQ